MLFFFPCFNCFNSTKSKENFLLVNLMGYNLKSRGLHFWKVFYHLKILGWTNGFRAIDDLPSAHWLETGTYSRLPAEKDPAPPPP